jgi:parallel beta-helix repeat protein
MSPGTTLSHASPVFIRCSLNSFPHRWPDKREDGATEDAINEWARKMADDPGEAERRQLEDQWRNVLFRPTIQVIGTDGVTVRGLKIQGMPFPRYAGKPSNDSVVLLRRASGRLVDCAVVGRLGRGVVVENVSEVMLENSVIAAFWGTGVVVEGAQADRRPSTLRMRGCVVRNCYHRGIAIGMGCNTTLIEGNWISGSAWHGIRYDHASPRIERNIIFGNARSGIYASGKTSAIIRQNIFLRNEKNGLSCRYDNGDTIETNLFHENVREAIAVLGASKPLIARNWFSSRRASIICGRAAGESPIGDAVGNPKVIGNVFVSTDPIQSGGKFIPVPLGNESGVGVRHTSLKLKG